MLLKRVRKSTTFLSFRVSENVKKKYEKIVSALREKGYEIDQDETVLRVMDPSAKGKRAVDGERVPGVQRLGECRSDASEHFAVFL